MTEDKYPEITKLKAVQEQSQAIHEFIEYLNNDKHILLCEWIGDGLLSTGGRYAPVNERLTSLVAKFLGIDEKKLEEEKQSILAEMRAASPLK